MEAKHLKLDSRIEELSKVERLIDEISEECQLSSEIYGKVLIAAIEAVNNAIIHGNKLDQTKKVNLEVDWDDSELNIIVQDQGPGFDYNNVPDPTLPENIENIHGRGVFLMGHLSDEIEFFEKGSKVKLTFNRETGGN